MSGHVEAAVKCIQAERKARQAGRPCLKSAAVGDVKGTVLCYTLASRQLRDFKVGAWFFKAVAVMRSGKCEHHSGQGAKGAMKEIKEPVLLESPKPPDRITEARKVNSGAASTSSSSWRRDVTPREICCSTEGRGGSTSSNLIHPKSENASMLPGLIQLVLRSCAILGCELWLPLVKTGYSLGPHDCQGI